MKSNDTSRSNYKAFHNPNTVGDVILSANAIGSPQILMLSGIGSFNHLKNLNISLQVDLKEGGHRIKDNPTFAFFADFDFHKRDSEMPQVVGIIEDTQFIIEAGIYTISPNTSIVPVATKLAFVKSRGSLILNGIDPRMNPRVYFNYLSKAEDLDGCMRLVTMLGRVEQSRKISSFWTRMRIETAHKEDLMDAPEEHIRRLCKSNVKKFYHYHNGCSVGSVVDKDYRVLGVKGGLRVIDGSILS